MGLFGSSKPKVVHLEGPRRFAVQLHGESNYQSALQKIARTLGSDYKREWIECRLVLEDDNKFDSNAVYGEISSFKVGYLDKVFAPNFRARLRKDGHAKAPVTCLAKLIGGGPGKSFGVLLDLPNEYTES